MTRLRNLALRFFVRCRPATVAGLLVVLGPLALHADLVYVETIFDDDAGGTADGLNGALVAGVSPDGRHVYVPGGAEVMGVGGDEMAIFTRNPTTGKLTYTDLVVNGADGVVGLDGPWKAAVAPDGEHVYVIAYNDAAVVVFDRDPATGGLAFVQTQIDGVSGVDGLNSPQDVAISPDGKHVYVAGAGEDKVAVFSRNSVSGALTFVEIETNGVGGVAGMEAPLGVAVSPDGANVYVTGFASNAVVTFSRNSTSGQLLYADTLFDTDLGVDGLEGAAYLGVSADGDHVYIAAKGDDSIAAFERSGGFGELSFVQVLVGGADVPAGLVGPVGVAITPDGAAVYVASQDGDAVLEFSRDASSGELSYERAALEGVGAVEGIDEAIGIGLSPDGEHLYVSGFSSDAIAVFATLPLIFAADFEVGLTEWSSAVE